MFFFYSSTISIASVGQFSLASVAAFKVSSVGWAITFAKPSVSSLEEHGLDSLDALELCCQIEDELGYIIEAEVMPKFSKVKHFINFIKHMEGYKAEHKILPQQQAHESEENWGDWIINGEKLKAKLYGYTQEKEGKKH